MQHAAVAVETYPLVDLDTDGRIDGDTEPSHHRKEFVVSADACAARSKIVCNALEHFDVPADGAQQVGCEQAAE